MNVYDLADRLEELYQGTHIQKAAETIRLQADKLYKYELRNQEQIKRIAELEKALLSIANEHVELSHDKIKWQCEDHIRWAKEALK